MSAVILDTHTWYWLLSGMKRLPRPAIETIEQAQSVTLCSISVYEVARKAKLGKWPGMDDNSLGAMIRASAGVAIDIVPSSVSAMRAAGTLDWKHRDPWDRMIAATALESGAVLVSADSEFDAVEGLKRIWK